MKKQYTGPWRLAHRGICQAAPENTLEAFRAAYHAGIEGLEIDIRMTRDGVIICKDGFKATTQTPQDYRALGQASGYPYEVTEVDSSSLFLVIHKPKAQRLPGS